MSAQVVLVTMPWDTLNLPSIQLGLLKRVLERDGFRVKPEYFNLTFMECLATFSASLSEPERITINDYCNIAGAYSHFGLGDWIFRDPSIWGAQYEELDRRYLNMLAERIHDQALLRRIHSIRTLIPTFLDQCARTILEAAPTVVGFTTVFSQNIGSLSLSRLLKSLDPKIRIVFGGANCDGPMGAAIHRNFPWVDVVVSGEGESVVSSVVRDLLNDGEAKARPGTYVRLNERSVHGGARTNDIIMDEVPLPDYDDYFTRLGSSNLRMDLSGDVRLLIETSRGCWYGEKVHCTFCGLNGSSMKFRSKSPQRALNDIITLAGRYKRTQLYAVDNIIDIDYLKDVLPQLAAMRFDLSFFYETKSNLKRAQVEYLREAGVVEIQPGIESLSTQILRLMRKGVTAFQNIRLIKWCQEIGISPSWNIIYGFPGEPADEYGRMAKLARTLFHLPPPKLTRLDLQRFSPYHSRPEDFGINVTGPAPWYSLVYGALPPGELNDIAYTFEFRYEDGRDPEKYIVELAAVIQEWTRTYEGDQKILTTQRGPGFLTIVDRRTRGVTERYILEEPGATIYLACADGARPPALVTHLRECGVVDWTEEDITHFLNELVEEGLMYSEAGQYLSLAIAERRRTDVLPLSDDAPTTISSSPEELIQLLSPRMRENRQP